MFGAKWCHACVALEDDLERRNVPHDTVDIDRDPAAYAAASRESGARAIPVTRVLRHGERSWVTGADGGRIEKLYRAKG